MIEEMVGSYGNRLLLAAAGVGAGFILLIGILWLMRRRGASSPFIRGGKNRQPRLQVLDAAAIDTRRRLVLVRRDNVEHLVMIGGPTDIVIESGITSRDATDATLRPQPVQEIPALTADTPVALPASRRPAAIAPPVPSPPDVQPQLSATNATPTMHAATPVVPAPAGPAPQTASPTQQPAAASRSEPRPRPPAPPQAVQPPTAPPVQTAPAPAIQPAPQVPSVENEVQNDARSEFERILEAEMASRSPPPQARPSEGRPALQQRREPVAPPAPAPSVIAARQVTASPPVAETVPDAEVQKEIARIFGEMSVTRDK